MTRRSALVLLASVVTAAATLTAAPAPPAAAATGGSITIVVDTNPADGTDIGFTGCQGSSCGPFVLDDDTDATRTDRVTAADLAAGTYTITQEAVASWTLTALSCTTSTGVTKDLANRRVTIVLAAGQNVRCTFTDESPSITLVQDSSPDNARDFFYTGCLGSGCGTFALDDDTDPTLPNTLTAGGLAQGTYTITQTPTSPWSLSGITCNSTSGVTKDVANRRVTIVLSSATHRTCTFTDVTQSLTIVDDDLTDSGQDHRYTGCGTAGCATFTLDDDADATHPSQHTSGPIPTGTYTVTQDAVDGWELAGINCSGYDFDPGSRSVSITLTTGGSHTCTFTNRPTPAPLTDVVDVTIGAQHACARTTGGEVRCWGDEVLGDGTQGSSATPAVVLAPSGEGPLTGVVDLAAGDAHTCAALQDGHAVCWGANASGQLGVGTLGAEPSTRAVVVLDEDGHGPLTGVLSLDAGQNRTCAALDTGEARCWGSGTSGALGNGTVSGSALPVPVMDGTAPLTGVVELVTGDAFTCARLDDAGVRCWGEGALGDGTTANHSFSPVVVTNPAGNGPLTGATSLSATWQHVCATLDTGRAACWGQLPSGLNSTTPAPRPVVVTGDDGEPVEHVDAVGAGDRYSCLTAAGGASCWGGSLAGLGAGPDIGSTSTPVPVIDQRTGAPLTETATIDAAYGTTCAVLTTGQAHCWGKVTGDGTTFTRYSAVPVVAPSTP